MKTIGLLGGMSWESSLEYYRVINEETRKQLGGSHSAKCLMYSFNFNEIEMLQHGGKWDELTNEIVLQSQKLKDGGAEFLLICTNTMHIMAPEIEKGTGLKVLHIADATGEEIKRRDMKKVGLIGTKFTMEGTFYKDRLKENHNIEVIIPDEEDRVIAHEIIYNELVVGKITDSSRKKYIEIIEKLAQKGAEGVILGCTEIPLLIKQSDVKVPVFDTTTIHAKAAVKASI